jgi:hypothetical protein
MLLTVVLAAVAGALLANLVRLVAEYKLTRDLLALDCSHSRAALDVWRAACRACDAFSSHPTPASYRAARDAIRHTRAWLALDAAERRIG